MQECPAGQGEQNDAPPLECVPKGHAWQIPTPGGLYVPALHSVGEMGAEPFIQERPAGQIWHTDAAPRLNLPSGHCLF